MTSPRRCSRSGCGRAAVATLTYVYAESTAVVGPLATVAEPHSYDLCEEHAVRLTVPRGWEVLRHAGEFPTPAPQVDDLEALAAAVREAGRVDVVDVAGGSPGPSTGAPPAARRDVAAPGAGRRPVRSSGSPRPGGSGAGTTPAAGATGGAGTGAAGTGPRRNHLRVVPSSADRR